MCLQKNRYARISSRYRHTRTVLTTMTMIGAVILILLSGGCPNMSGAMGRPSEWYVPDDFGSIGGAIGNAVAGDTIFVASGTYSENISLKDGVTLLGEDRDTTIIEGGGGDAAVSSSSCGADTVIDGFTITKGAGMMAGGMYNYNSSVTVRNCSFTANRADEGGGMHNSGGSPTIENCVFSGNTGIGAYNSGAGMYNVGSSPTISGCIFENNVAAKGSDDWTGRGGGMYNKDCANVTIDECVFQGNQAGNSTGFNFGIGYGCGMYNENSIVTLTDCAFMFNRDADSSGLPTAHGGGIYNASGTDCTLINCVFVANSSSYGTLNGSSGSTSTLYNCTICSNEAIAGILYIGGTLTVYNSILWDNNFCHPPDPARIVRNEGGTITITYSNVEGGYSGTGNIDADPQFDTYPSYTPNVPGEIATSWYTSTTQDFGDLRLSSGSPCIDAGNNSDVPTGTATDIAGRTRILDGPDPGTTATVDMGAYEY